jgi:hypothetical protein
LPKHGMPTKMTIPRLDRSDEGTMDALDGAIGKTRNAEIDLRYLSDGA